MSDTYEVLEVSAKPPEEWGNEHGRYHDILLKVAGPGAPEDGIVIRSMKLDNYGAIAAKAGPPKVGDSITGELLDNGNRPPKLKPEFTGSSSSGSGSAPRDDATGRSIERQVALKAATEIVAAGKEDPSKWLSLADRADEWLQAGGVATEMVEAEDGGDDEIPF